LQSHCDADAKDNSVIHISDRAISIVGASQVDKSIGLTFLRHLNQGISTDPSNLKQQHVLDEASDMFAAPEIPSSSAL